MVEETNHTLDFTLGNTNPQNKGLYENIYSTLEHLGKLRHVDGLIGYLSKSLYDKIEPENVPIAIRTIYLEQLRNSIIDYGVDITSDTDIRSALGLLDALVEIENNNAIASILSEFSKRDLSLETIVFRLGIEIQESTLDTIVSDSKYIDRLYEKYAERLV